MRKFIKKLSDIFCKTEYKNQYFLRLSQTIFLFIFQSHKTTLFLGEANVLMKSKSYMYLFSHVLHKNKQWILKDLKCAGHISSNRRVCFKHCIKSSFKKNSKM